MAHTNKDLDDFVAEVSKWFIELQKKEDKTELEISLIIQILSDQRRAVIDHYLMYKISQKNEE